MHRLSTPLGFAASLVAVAAAAWAVIKFFNPVKEVDLTVWIKQVIDLSLPAQASSLEKLALTYNALLARGIAWLLALGVHKIV